MIQFNINLGFIVIIFSGIIPKHHQIMGERDKIYHFSFVLKSRGSATGGQLPPPHMVTLTWL